MIIDEIYRCFLLPSFAQMLSTLTKVAEKEAELKQAKGHNGLFCGITSTDIQADWSAFRDI